MTCQESKIFEHDQKLNNQFLTFQERISYLLEEYNESKQTLIDDYTKKAN